MTSLLLPLVLMLTSADVEDLATKLASQKGLSVAVYPTLLQETDGHGYQLCGTRQGEREMDRIRAELEYQADGSFTVIDKETVLAAVGPIEPRTLSDEKVRSSIMSATNTNFLIIGVQKSNDEASLVVELKPFSRSGNSFAFDKQQRFEKERRHTLSDLAYGASNMELRRWSGDQLILQGFRDPQTNRSELQGMGEVFERLQAARVREGLPHPLSQSDFPYSITVKVNGKPRPAELIGSDYYVTLNAGEQPEFVIGNRSSKRVLVGLYIDGENSIEKKYEHPLQTPTGGHWSIRPNFRGLIRGWLFRGDEDSDTNTIRPFIVNRDAIAAEQRSPDDPVGTITALFYTSGTPGLEIPPELITRGVNIEAGDPEPVKKRTAKGSKGLLLASATIYYRSSKEIDACAEYRLPKLTRLAIER